jgi:hypothetical protein
MDNDNSNIEEVEKVNSQNISEGNEELVLTEADLDILIEQMEIIQHSEQFTGPIPHPEHMQKYQDIDQSFPDRILKMAESNLSHKQSVEKIVIYGQLFMGFLGWATPSGIAFYVLHHAILFTKDGKSIEALIALITAIAALGGAFYMKKKVEKK